MPPGSAKSTYGSWLFPPWIMAQTSGLSILAASHTTERAEHWGRRIRGLIVEHGSVLDIQLSGDSQAAGRWALENGGEYYAAGVGTGIAGFRADGAVIDDPVRSREDADSELIRDKTWEWYKSDLMTRLRPGGWVVLIQCMTGDTPVLMGTGQEKPLRDIRPGDRVATYEDGKISVSVVRNWANNGPDRVFTIRMKSGITVKANARHPFLVEEDGDTKWQRTATLKKGSRILRVIGGASHVPQKAVTNQPYVKACAVPTTTSIGGKLAYGRLQSILGLGETRICAIATVLAFQSMRNCWQSRAEYALCVNNHPRKIIRALTGMVSSASITAMMAEMSGVFSATIATLRLGTGRLKKLSSQPLNTYEITRDSVVEVVDSGVEDVFDIEIERTENFIANGLVSHNTRWHEDDLAGRILAEDERLGKRWEVVSIPAIAQDGDILGRKPGEYLWEDDDYGYGKELRRHKREQPARNWSALFMQTPAPDEGDYFKEQWLKPYIKSPPLSTMKCYGASDMAVTENGGDWTVHLVVGVDSGDRIWLLDMWRGQTGPDTWIEKYCDFVYDYRPLGWAEEKGQILLAVGAALEKRLRERRLFIARRQFGSRVDKQIRAQSIRARMALDGLYVPEQAVWYPQFRAELLTFPAGKHDDVVDSMSLIGQIVDLMIGGMEPVPIEPPRILSTNPSECTVTLEDCFNLNENRIGRNKRSGRI